MREDIIISLQTIMDKNFAFLDWVTKNGGIYSPVDNLSKKTTDNNDLTLLNPVHIMDQISKTEDGNSAFFGHLISLNPLTPQNKADEWETKALNAIFNNHDLQEISATSTYQNQKAIRLIRPFYVEESCFSCHKQQNYQVGDLRGAVSVGAVLDPYVKLLRSRQFSLLPGYTLLWLAGQ